MSQLVLCRVRDDGDYDTIAAVQETDSPPTPALQWILQMHEYMTFDNEGDLFVIFRLEELSDVISFDERYSPNDLTWLCENTFNSGATQLGENLG